MSVYVTKTFAKCIVAGEHSVLRGYPALVFPVHRTSLTLSYKKTAQEFSVEFTGPYAKELGLVFWGVLEEALKKVGKKRSDLSGELTVEDNIPIGGGLGASAAVCVAVARLWQELNFITVEGIYEFSRNLENLFHGESSGVDIAAAMANQGLFFLRGGERTPLIINWQPAWYLSYSGKKGMTSECVQKVKAVGMSSPGRLEKIDKQMLRSVELAKQALEMDEKSGMELLANSIDLANNCFRQWDLIDHELQQHMDLLTQRGALAVKPTGSGGGGYVLSLWTQAPNCIDELKMIPLSVKSQPSRES